MVKINFYLKGCISTKKLAELKILNRSRYNDEINQPKPIIISIVKDKQRLIVHTKRKVAPKFWDRKQKAIKFLTDTPPDAQLDQEWLTNAANALKTELKRMKPNAKVTTEQLYNLIELKQNKELVSTWEANINDFLSEHKTKEGHSLKPNTVKKYLGLKNHIEKFQGHTSCDLNAINIDWINEFKRYLLEEKKIINNSVTKYVKVLKPFLRWCKQKQKVHLEFELSDIKTVEKFQEVHVLEIEEVRKLKRHVFKHAEHDAIRDVFLFQCCTGQRYSDIEKITWDSIQKNGTKMLWALNTTKTDENIIVPLSKEAQRILKKYKDHNYPLPRFTNQYINRELKNMAKEVGLNRKVKLVYYRDNQKEEVYKALSDVISTHMARKTFISSSLKKGVPERAVRAVSGHKDEKSFKRYVNLGDAHHDMLCKVWDKI